MVKVATMSLTIFQGWCGRAIMPVVTAVCVSSKMTQRQKDMLYESYDA